MVPHGFKSDLPLAAYTSWVGFRLLSHCVRDNYYFIILNYLASNFVIVKVHQGLGFSRVFSTLATVSSVDKSS